MTSGKPVTTPGSLIIHCQVFWPDTSAVSQMITAVAEDAVAAGWRVTVVTSARGYNLDESYPPLSQHRGIAIRRTTGFRFDRHSSFGRLTNYLSFALLSCLEVLRLPRHDCLVVTSVPPFSLFIGGLFSLIRRRPFVYVIEDLYPELAVASGFLKSGSIICRFVNWVFDCYMRKAAETIVIGEYMQQQVLKSHPRLARAKVHPIHNWHDGRLIYPLARPTGDRPPVCFQYSGNFGAGHDFETLAAAMEHFRDHPDIRFEFVGRGKRRPILEELAQRNNLRTCFFSDYVPNEKLNESLNRADVAIVTLIPGFEGLLVPSKIYGIMAAGRPVLYIGPARGEIPTLIRDHQLGWIVATGDVPGLVAVIKNALQSPATRHQFGLNARSTFTSHYDRPLATARYLEVFSRAVQSHA